MIDGTDRTGCARRGAGPSGPEGADVFVAGVSVLKIPSRASVDVFWSFENVLVGCKLRWLGP